jgi:hypothetical protein
MGKEVRRGIGQRKGLFFGRRRRQRAQGMNERPQDGNACQARRPRAYGQKRRMEQHEGPNEGMKYNALYGVRASSRAQWRVGRGRASRLESKETTLES